MIYLEPIQEELLKHLAAEEGASEAEIMRRALDLYGREHLKDPLAELVGAFTGGPTDGASQHDHYLIEGPNA